MTKQFSKNLGLICISLSAFFYGCTDEDNVGAGLTSGDNNAFRVDTFSIISEVILDNDSSNTLNKGLFLVGSYTDDVYGEIESEAYFNLVYSSSDFVAPTDAVIDSIIFSVTQSTNHTYGELNVAHNYELYKLSEAIDLDAEKIYNNQTLADDGENLIESESFLPYPANDSIISFQVATSLGELLFSLDALTDLNGLVLKGASSNISVQGIYPYADETNFEIYYHTSDTDTLSTVVQVSRSFTSISSDRSTTDLSMLVSAGDNVSTADLGNQIFVQSGTGVRTTLRFPTLDNFLNSLDGHLINLAYLEIHVDTLTNTSINKPQVMNLYSTENGINTSEELDDDTFLSFYDNATDYYTFDEEDAVYRIPLTYYLNNLKTQNEASGTYSLTPWYDGYQLHNFVGFDADPSNGEMAMKLVIYYSESSLE